MKEIPVGQDRVALVDDEDYALVSQYRWRTTSRQHRRTVYAINGKTRLLMHKLITGFKQTDHINGNGLDNRRVNLRESTSAQNRMNMSKQRGEYTSEYKGVSWDYRRKKWRAYIQVDRKHIYLGRFDSEVDAAKVYDAAAVEYFGAFAYTNIKGGNNVA